LEHDILNYVYVISALNIKILLLRPQITYNNMQKIFLAVYMTERHRGDNIIQDTRLTKRCFLWNATNTC